MVKVCISILLISAMPLAARSATIAESIRAAKAGDTIVIEGPNVYRERIVIDKPLRLIGRRNPVIDAQASGTALSIRAANVEINGFVIRNSGASLRDSDSAILIAGHEAVVENCRIENDGFGIYIQNAKNCRIQANTIVGRAGLASAKRGNGIHLWKTRGNRILGNFISEKRDGIYFSYADENTITSNRVERTRFGIHYMYSHRNQLVGNRLTDNAVGATLMFARGCLVEGNDASANRRHGLLLKQVEGSRVIHNRVSRQNRGLFVQQCVQNRFEGNRVANNDIGLYLSGGSEQNTFVGNAFIANTDQVWQPVGEVDKGRFGSNSFHDGNRGNYWSDYTGVDANGDGIGDTPYHETDLFGYIVDRHPETRVFALSPAVALLRKGEELLPVLDLTGVHDFHPLMRPPDFASTFHVRSPGFSRSGERLELSFRPQDRLKAGLQTKHMSTVRPGQTAQPHRPLRTIQMKEAN